MAAELATSLTPADDEERLEQAEALVRGFCGWHIAPSRAEAEYVLADAAHTILLPSLYVTEIESITDDDSTVYVEVDDYTATSAGVVSRVGNYWPSGTVVTFTHGYAAPPAEVTAVVQAVASRLKANPGSVIREQAGPFAYSPSLTGANQAASLSLLEAEKDVLRRYRIPAVA